MISFTVGPKNEWRKFVSPTCPGPRSAHAVVASPAGGGKLYLFGMFSPQIVARELPVSMTTFRWRVLVSIPEFLPSLSRFLVFRHLNALMGAHRDQSPPDGTIRTQVCKDPTFASSSGSMSSSLMASPYQDGNVEALHRTFRRVL